MYLLKVWVVCLFLIHRHQRLYCLQHVLGIKCCHCLSQSATEQHGRSKKVLLRFWARGQAPSLSQCKFSPWRCCTTQRVSHTAHSRGLSCLFGRLLRWPGVQLCVVSPHTVAPSVDKTSLKLLRSGGCGTPPKPQVWIHQSSPCKMADWSIHHSQRPNASALSCCTSEY